MIGSPQVQATKQSLSLFSGNPHQNNEISYYTKGAERNRMGTEQMDSCSKLGLVPVHSTKGHFSLSVK